MDEDVIDTDTDNEDPVEVGDALPAMEVTKNVSEMAEVFSSLGYTLGADQGKRYVKLDFRLKTLVSAFALEVLRK